MMKTIMLSLACLFLFSSCTLLTAQAEQEGTRWLLQSLREQPPLEDTVITAKFSQDGISGTSGCNYYGAKISFLISRKARQVRKAFLKFHLADHFA